MAKIVDFLNTKTDALVLIDEAGKITPNVMLLLHDIREATKHNCSIVMAGMPLGVIWKSLPNANK